MSVAQLHDEVLANGGPQGVLPVNTIDTGDYAVDEDDDYDGDYIYGDTEENVQGLPHDEDEDSDAAAAPANYDADLASLKSRRIASSKNGISRHLSRSDANSIVGGESYNELDQNKAGHHPVSDPNKTTEEQEKKTSGSIPHSSNDKSLFNDSQKVFSFSLPFGGFSSIRSNIYQQILLFKLDNHLPSLPLRFNSNSNNNKNEDPEIEQMRLKLERQQSISTIDEERYFENYRGTDNVRMRAVKHSISANINEILPDFIHNKKEKPYESVFNDIDGNIIVMGGYRGSILRDAKTGKRVWIPLKAGFNLRKINLLLGPNKEDEINASKLIYPDGVLKNIGPIDICKRLIKRLQSNPKTNCKEFGYDWRLNLGLISSQLEKVLQENYDKTGKPTLVIAHSMGGLVAHLTMQRNPKLFRGLLYVGVPSECLNILGPLRFGDSVILSDKILTFETNFMMRSGFCFLPLSGQVFYDKVTRECYKLDLFNPDTWVEYNLNPLVAKKRKLHEEALRSGTVSPSTPDSGSSFSTINSISSKIRSYRSLSINMKNKLSSSPNNSVSSSPISSSFNDQSTTSLDTVIKKKPVSPPKSPPPTETTSPNEIPLSYPYAFTFTEAYNYLADALKMAKEFILGLDYKEELEAEYPPLAVVYGNQVPSVRGSNVRGIQDIKDGNYYEFFYGHGDGVVHQRWTMPQPKGFSIYNEETGEGQIVGKFSSSSGHINLMSDFEAMGNALYSILEAEKKWPERAAKLKMRLSKAFGASLNEIPETD